MIAIEGLVRQIGHGEANAWLGVVAGTSRRLLAGDRIALADLERIRERLTLWPIRASRRRVRVAS